MIMTDKITSRIIRLKNGDDVIAKIVKSDRRKLTLEKPFLFRTQSMVDPMSGMKKDVTMLQSWTAFADGDEITIQQESILAFLSPTGETEKLYSIEKKREEELKKNRSVINYDDEENPNSQPPKNPLSNLFDMNKNVDDAMKKMYDELADQLDGVGGLDDLDEDEMQEFIVMTLMIPPEMLKRMLDQGIIKPEQMSEFLFENMNSEKISEEYTGDDKNHPDFGNRLTDWSSDIDEYLK
tara:strand:- start:3564 stop:4277 length:714 start_codon:yes stop_codon:yes gene_type:complete